MRCEIFPYFSLSGLIFSTSAATAYLALRTYLSLLTPAWVFFHVFPETIDDISQGGICLP